MTAAEARVLKIGDTVGASFGSHFHDDCIITEINWPVFTLQWKDSQKELQTRTRTYRTMSIVKPKQIPAWLKYENQ